MSINSPEKIMTVDFEVKSCIEECLRAQDDDSRMLLISELLQDKSKDILQQLIVQLFLMQINCGCYNKLRNGQNGIVMRLDHGSSHVLNHHATGQQIIKPETQSSNQLLSHNSEMEVLHKETSHHTSESSLDSSEFSDEDPYNIYDQGSHDVDEISNQEMLNALNMKSPSRFDRLNDGTAYRDLLEYFDGNFVNIDDLPFDDIVDSSVKRDNGNMEYDEESESGPVIDDDIDSLIKTPLPIIGKSDKGSGSSKSWDPFIPSKSDTSKLLDKSERESKYIVSNQNIESYHAASAPPISDQKIKQKGNGLTSSVSLNQMILNSCEQQLAKYTRGVSDDDLIRELEKQLDLNSPSLSPITSSPFRIHIKKKPRQISDKTTNDIQPISSDKISSKTHSNINASKDSDPAHAERVPKPKTKKSQKVKRYLSPTKAFLQSVADVIDAKKEIRNSKLPMSRKLSNPQRRSITSIDAKHVSKSVDGKEKPSKTKPSEKESVSVNNGRFSLDSGLRKKSGSDSNIRLARQQSS